MVDLESTMSTDARLEQQHELCAACAKAGLVRG
jgi:hypothetical protein